LRVEDGPMTCGQEERRHDDRAAYSPRDR
jgi:hypothetical protein